MANRPQSLLLTVFGLYARRAGGSLPVAGLVQTLATVDVHDQAVRAAVSRLKQSGILTPTKNGPAGYRLTAKGEAVLADGDRRIFQPRLTATSSGWVLCVFSIPESQRAKRHVLRQKLTWLGFGQVTPGVWVAPVHNFDAVAAMLDQQELKQYVSLFRAEHVCDDEATAVARWWDLPKLIDMYEWFIAQHPLPTTHRSWTALSKWIMAVNDWRRMPYLDPGLPAELLPPDWPGHRAHELFQRLEQRFAATAATEAKSLLLLAGRG